MFEYLPETLAYVAANLPFDILTIWVTMGFVTAIAVGHTRRVLWILSLDLSIAVKSTKEVFSGFLWLVAPAHGHAEDLISFLYAATTLLPTAAYVALLCVAALAKPVAAAGQAAGLYLLDVHKEHSESPENIPVATMTGALMGLILSIGIVALGLLSSF